jgi:hypothetical protein
LPHFGTMLSNTEDQYMAETVHLSESSLALLRFLIKGYRMSVTEVRLGAYRELVAARIMEPVPGSGCEYRFTEEGMARRDEILEREQKRIDRERYEPPDGRLSESARERLRGHLAGDDKPTEENRPAYRELVAARVMIPAHSFVGGREAQYRFTYWGWKRRFELAEMDCAKETA